jgi:hypothetical protein
LLARQFGEAAYEVHCPSTHIQPLGPRCQ